MKKIYLRPETIELSCNTIYALCSGGGGSNNTSGGTDSGDPFSYTNPAPKKRIPAF